MGKYFAQLFVLPARSSSLGQMGGLYFRGPDILARSPDATSLDTGLSVDATVPRLFDQVLNFEYGRLSISKVLSTLGFGSLDI